MSDKIEISKHIMGNSAELHFKGSIDEDIDFEDISNLSVSEYIFDFNDIIMINSCGIREWIKYIETLPEDAKITYKNCPQIIIEQINMVHGFIRKGASIESFYAPYYCEACDKESKIHLKAAQIKDAKAPEVKCPHCGSEDVEFDAIEAQYFSFLKSQNS